MDKNFLHHLETQISMIKEQGLYKDERLISSPQNAHIKVAQSSTDVINLCANNYLGLANHPALIQAAKDSLDHYGLGLASVRFICGTQTIHKVLEDKISNFLKCEDTILYSSCFDANGGVFETLFAEEDAIISDALNHASIIDGIRLSKAQRFRYNFNDMVDLEEKCKLAMNARFRVIVTDGVFSMDGTIANLRAICDLAEKYQALVMVDDSHAVGFIGEKGAGTPELCGVQNRVDIVSGTLGKALGGASGGYIAAKKEIISFLRQKSRPYLFSNTLAPSLVGASIEVFNLLAHNGHQLRQKLRENTAFFRQGLSRLGFKLIPGEHPIIPVMLGDAALAKHFSEKLLVRGVYVVGFSFPVVPKGLARIRTQISAAHEITDLQYALESFELVGRELGVIR